MRELKSIDDLKPDPDNPRRIVNEAAAGLRASIDRFGDIAGIVWNARTGELVSGHQRVKQLLEAGAQLEAGALVINGERWPVRVVDWTRSQQRAANVTANNPAIGGEYTPELSDILSELKVDLGDDDFGALRLDEIEIPELPTPPIEQDEVPDPPKDPVTKTGDVWRLGDHRVVCGDAAEIRAQHADAVVTDPPYGISDKPIITDPGGERHRRYGQRANNTWHPPSEWDATISPALFGSFRRVAPVVACFGYWRKREEVTAAIGLPIRCEIVWAKDMHTGFPCPVSPRDERIWLFSNDGIQHYSHETSVWDQPVIPTWNHKVHKNEKPVALLTRLVSFLTAKAAAVADPCLGSGTTLIAAEQLDRICYGIEIEPRYVDVTIERWQNLTGGKARRINSG